MNEDGDIDFEAARAKVPPKVPKEEVDRIIAACQSISKYNIGFSRDRHWFDIFSPH